jgi:magnesium chelatase accessory protein
MTDAGLTDVSAGKIVTRDVVADGLSWRVVEMGQGDTILLIHGTAASVHSWRDVMPLLAQTHHVVALDLPGHGGTQAMDTGDYSLSRMAQGVKAVMSAMKLVPRIAVGHSAGAAILAWAYANCSTGPERFVFFNGAFYPFSGVAGSLFSPIAKLIALNSFLPSIFAYFATRGMVEKLIKDTGSIIRPNGIDFYHNLLKEPKHVAAALRMMAAWDLRGIDACFSRLKSKCVFVVGKNDKAVPPETSQRAAARVGTSEMHVLDGYGHLLHEEAPELAASLIRGDPL